MLLSERQEVLMSRHHILTLTSLDPGYRVYWTRINRASARVETISLADVSPHERKGKYCRLFSLLDQLYIWCLFPQQRKFIVKLWRYQCPCQIQLTFSSPVVSNGYTSACSGPYLYLRVVTFLIFLHSGTLALRTKRQSAQM